MRKSELQIIEDLKILFEPNSRIREGIGDDAAIIEHSQLISTDTIVENTHFLRDRCSWQEVAYKLFASNASDMAAMGGIPKVYTLALSLPEYWQDQDCNDFIAGVREFLREFPADLIGGDLVKSKEFFATVTVLGKSVYTPWRRSDAKTGDFIYCTGTLGDSKFWLDKELGQQKLPIQNPNYFRQRHYKPTPRINWVEELGKHSITSAIDISDGVIEDLQKLCLASDKSFMINANLIPISTHELGDKNVQEHEFFYRKEALIGGEDYELLFTVTDPLDIEDLSSRGVFVTEIGRILDSDNFSYIQLDGQNFSPKDFTGFRH